MRWNLWMKRGAAASHPCPPQLQLHCDKEPSACADAPPTFFAALAAPAVFEEGLKHALMVLCGGLSKIYPGGGGWGGSRSSPPHRSPSPTPLDLHTLSQFHKPLEADALLRRRHDVVLCALDNVFDGPERVPHVYAINGQWVPGVGPRQGRTRDIRNCHPPPPPPSSSLPSQAGRRILRRRRWTRWRFCASRSPGTCFTPASCRAERRRATPCWPFLARSRRSRCCPSAAGAATRGRPTDS